MIRLKRTTQPISTSLTAYGAQEFEEMFTDWRTFQSQSLGMWDIYDDEAYVGTFGITKGSLMGTGARFWLLAGDRLSNCPLRTWRVFRRMMRRLVRLFGHVTVFVREGFDPGRRLVRFFGFSQKTAFRGFEVWERWRQL